MKSEMKIMRELLAAEDELEIVSEIDYDSLRKFCEKNKNIGDNELVKIPECFKEEIKFMLFMDEILKNE